MKTKSIISTAILSGISLFLIACGQKKDPSAEAFETLMQSIPADVAAFAGGYIPVEEQADALDRGDWGKVVAALKQNPAISDLITKSLEASPDAKYFITRWLGGTDIVGALSEACAVAPAPTAFVAYIPELGEKKLESEDVPEFALAVTMSEKYVKSVAHFLYCCKGEHDELGKGEGVWTSEVSGEKTVYTYTKGKVILSFALSGNDMLFSVSSDTDALSKLEAVFASPAKNPVKDSAVFKKVANGISDYNFVGFCNFDGIKDFRTPAANDTPADKIFKETAESVAVFGDFSFSENTASAVARMEFSKPLCVHEALTSMGKNKLATLANALPGASYALGLALPELTQELADDAKIPATELEKIRRFDPKKLYLSVGDLEKIAGLLEGDYASLPQVFAKAECGDNSVLLQEKNIAPFFDGSLKRTLNGTDVYSFVMFGVNYALLGKTGLYISNAVDSTATLALAQGTGKSLEQEGTFNDLAEKLSGENALEIFCDDRAGIQLQIALAESQLLNPELPAEAIYTARMSMKFQELILALTKKSLSGFAVRRNGTAIELQWVSEGEYDFDALAEGIKNLK